MGKWSKRILAVCQYYRCNRSDITEVEAETEAETEVYTSAEIVFNRSQFK